jgi:ribose 5-phosphate isomerase A
MSNPAASIDERTINQFKQAAANSAVAQLRDGMVVGLGSGTTATLALAAIGQRVKEGLRLICISTSEKIADQARLLTIPLSTLEDHCAIDMTIDGADEVEEGTLNLIKGGGGNLLREKIVAVASSRMIVVVDERKVTSRLGSHSSLAVEVVPFGWKTTAKRLEKVGAHPTLRVGSDRKTFLTDGGHYILDCAFGPIDSPRQLQADLDSIVGVVEHGLFIGIAYQVLVGGPEGVRILNRKIDP